MKRIAYIITGLEVGGAEVQLLTVCEKLILDGYKVRVYSISDKVSLLNKFNSSGVDVSVYPINKNPINIFLLFWSIIRFSPDILHSHMIHSNFFCGILSLVYFKPKYFMTVHNVEEGHNFIRWFVFKFIKKNRVRCSHVSNIGRNLYRDRTNVEIDLYINPINLDSFNNFQRKRSNIVKWINVASLTKQKQHDLLLMAFNKYIKEYPNSTLTIVGEGRERSNIEKKIRELGLGKSVTLYGYCKNIPQVLYEADAFVLSSAWEGLPVALVEAATSGLPIVSTNVGDVPLIVFDSKNGFLTNSGNINELFSAMLKLKNVNCLESYSEYSMAKSKDFDIELIIKTLKIKYFS